PGPDFAPLTRSPRLRTPNASSHPAGGVRRAPKGCEVGTQVVHPRHTWVERVRAALRGVLPAELGPGPHVVPRGPDGVLAGLRVGTAVAARPGARGGAPAARPVDRGVRGRARGRD